MLCLYLSQLLSPLGLCQENNLEVLYQIFLNSIQIKVRRVLSLNNSFPDARTLSCVNSFLTVLTRPPCATAVRDNARQRRRHFTNRSSAGSGCVWQRREQAGRSGRSGRPTLDAGAVSRGLAGGAAPPVGSLTCPEFSRDPSLSLFQHVARGALPSVCRQTDSRPQRAAAHQAPPPAGHPESRASCARVAQCVSPCAGRGPSLGVCVSERVSVSVHVCVCASEFVC